MYDGWNLINVYFKSHVQYLSIGSHFTHFYCIGRRFGAFSPRVEIVKTTYTVYFVPSPVYSGGIKVLFLGEMLEELVGYPTN